MELDELRKEIDETDAELVRLFVRRMALSGKVADYKRGRGLPVTDAAREEEKLKAVRALAGEEFGDYAAGLYRFAMDESERDMVRSVVRKIHR